MERRKSKRIRRRITCELRGAGPPCSGIVLDASPSGLFVQTDATLAPGTRVEVSLRAAYLPADLQLTAQVVRTRADDSPLATLSRSGLGLEVIEAPEAYTRFAEGFRNGEAATPSATEAPEADAPGETETLYKARLQHKLGDRTRTVSILAASAQEAEDQIARELSDEWKLVDLQPA